MTDEGSSLLKGCVLECVTHRIDQEMIGDDGLEDLQKWRDFIKSDTGVELTIIA